MSTSKVRVSGSGYTILTFEGKKIEYLRSFNDAGQQPVAQPEPIQGIGDDYPIEIAFPRALGAGRIDFTTYELWERGAWQSIFNNRFGSASDILDVFKQQLSKGSIQVQRVIKGPDGKGRVMTYQNLVVVSISDAENVNLSTMTQPKSVSCMYTRVITTKTG